MINPTKLFFLRYKLTKNLRNSVYKTIIEDHLQSDQLYLDSSFSLMKLSAITGLSLPFLSTFINAEYGMNFNEFINQYRIAHFKNLIDKPAYKNLTLEAIAFQSGFKSRTTFVRSFTKVCKCSPREYYKNLKTRSH